MLGVFTLVNQAIDIEDYADKKNFLFTQGYERILKQLNYPNNSYKNAEQVKGKSLKFEEYRSETIIPDFDEIRVETTSGGMNCNYYYFIKHE